MDMLMTSGIVGVDWASAGPAAAVGQQHHAHLHPGPLTPPLTPPAASGTGRRPLRGAGGLRMLRGLHGWRASARGLARNLGSQMPSLRLPRAEVPAPIAAVLRAPKRVVERAIKNAQPRGPGCHDHSPSEKFINTATSLPFCLLGAHIARRPEHRAYGASLVGVGLSAMAYHASGSAGPARLRTLLRKLDYVSIAGCTAALLRTINPSMPRALTLLSAAVTPVQPLLVTAANAGLLEGTLALRAARHPGQRRATALHAGVAALAGGLFAKGDRLPFAHALWHTMAAAAIGLTPLPTRAEMGMPMA